MEFSKDRILSIIVPTYNRGDVLDNMLDILHQYVIKGFCFDLIICNNGSTDNTGEVIKKWIQSFPSCQIVSHSKNVGYDRNVASGLKEVKTEYYYLLSEKSMISMDTLSRIFELINNEHPNALILKTTSSLNVPSETYSDINKLMKKQGWHLTNLCSCVVKSEAINDNTIFRYLDSLYLHYGVLVEYLCVSKSFDVIYDERNCVYQHSLNQVKQVNWNRVFSTFGKQYYILIMSFPHKINIEAKEKVLLDHNQYTKVLSIKSILRQRINYSSILDKDYKDNRKYLPFVSITPLWKYDLIMNLPIFAVKLLRRLYNFFVYEHWIR